mmetsp:Transcript_5812/g.12779  ORF Transcript_5812/g.12779 Transcript_5812/m.12779 type:complete len:243 (+) Transcript_5812:1008-1736(+)
MFFFLFVSEAASFLLTPLETSGLDFLLGWLLFFAPPASALQPRDLDRGRDLDLDRELCTNAEKKDGPGDGLAGGGLLGDAASALLGGEDGATAAIVTLSLLFTATSSVTTRESVRELERLREECLRARDLERLQDWELCTNAEKNDGPGDMSFGKHSSGDDGSGVFMGEEDVIVLLGADDAEDEGTSSLSLPSLEVTSSTTTCLCCTSFFSECWLDLVFKRKEDLRGIAGLASSLLVQCEFS